MPGKLVVARMPLANAEAKNHFIKLLSNAADYALSKEPGVRKYAVCLPREELDSNVVYAIEEYADEEAYDAHMATDGVKGMITWMTSGPPRLDSDPQIQQLETMDGFSFSRPGLAGATNNNSEKEESDNLADPHVLLAELTYHPGGLQESLPYWRAIVDTGRENEPGTWVYAVSRDPGDETRLVLLETYVSPEYLVDVHVPSRAIQESIKNTKHLRTGLKHTKLKLIGGFLHR